MSILEQTLMNIPFAVNRNLYFWYLIFFFFFVYISISCRGACPSIKDGGGLSALERAMEMGAITDEELFVLLAEGERFKHVRP